VDNKDSESLEFPREEERVDVLLVSSNSSVSVRKLPLATKSLVFKTMMQQAALKIATSRAQSEEEGIGDNAVSIQVPFLTGSTLRQVLHYVITNEPPPKLTSMSSELIAAADKLELEHLKNLAEMSLLDSAADKLTIDNVCARLTLASRHNCQHLWRATVDFTRRNFDRIETTMNWKTLFTESPDIAKAVLNDVGPRRRETIVTISLSNIGSARSTICAVM
jgi:hypothetical protein